jgi:hypothetical protein
MSRPYLHAHLGRGQDPSRHGRRIGETSRDSPEVRSRENREEGLMPLSSIVRCRSVCAKQHAGERQFSQLEPSRACREGSCTRFIRKSSDRHSDGSS